MHKESFRIKLLSTLAISIGVLITTYWIKHTSWESEEIYCFGQGFITAGLLIKFWNSDVLIGSVQNKRLLIKILEFILFTAGMIVVSYGLKDTSWESKERTFLGGVLLALGYVLREWTIEKYDHVFTNSMKLYLVIFSISILTFLSSIYSSSQDCKCEDKLNDIERKIEYLDRY